MLRWALRWVVRLLFGFRAYNEEVLRTPGPVLLIPNHVSWIDIAGWAAPAGLLFLVVALQIAKGPLYPLRDPRLRESMRMENI